MANRNFANGGKMYAMHVMPTMINANILIGSTGAVTSFTGPMVSSVTRTSTGIYVLHLANNFNAVIFAHGSVSSPVSGLSGISTVEIQNAPSTSIQSLATPTITVKVLDHTGAVADPASGSTVSVLVIANNSSIKAG
jgi:hypothetical protein